MTNKTEFFFKYMGHYKYPLIIVIGILMVGIFSESSTFRLMQLTNQRNDLKEETKALHQKDKDAQSELNALKNSPNMVEKVAREHYFMKKDNEDVFVLETDIPEPEEKTEEQ